MNTTPQQCSGVEAFTALEAWQELVEYDDRTSPDEHPDMALITFEELRMFMSRANFTGCTCGEVAGEDPECREHGSTPATLTAHAQALLDAGPLIMTAEEYNRICAKINARAKCREIMG